VAVRAQSGQWITFQWFRTWYAAKMMLLAVIKAAVKYNVKLASPAQWHSSVVAHRKAFKWVVTEKLDLCKVKWLHRSQQLFARFPSDRSVCSIWFMDEKTFTVATPVNSQNDYAGISRKKNILAIWFIHEWQHFNHRVMVSAATKISVVLVNPGIKLNSFY